MAITPKKKKKLKLELRNLAEKKSNTLKENDVK